VAETGGGVVGWAALSAYDEKPCFHRTGSTSTYVQRGARGAGVGTALRLHLMEQARARGFHTLVSRAWATNETSLALWLRLGWRKVARLREVVDFEGRLIDCYLIQVMLEEGR
jgi:phosphinothricin acetyltransferase